MWGALIKWDSPIAAWTLFTIMNYGNAQGVVTPIDDVVTAATRVKKRSRGQRLFLATVKRSRTVFKLSKVVKMQFWMVKLL